MSLQKPDLNKPVFKIYPNKKKLVLEGKCATCGKEIKEEDFRNQISKREYSISGTCQECQDKVFGTD